MDTNTILNCLLDCTLIGLIIYVAIIGIIAARKMDKIEDTCNNILLNRKTNIKQKKNDNN